MGGRRTHNGKVILNFGIDMIEKEKADFSVLFTHEAFHAYHFQKYNSLMADFKKGKRLFTAMSYIEGLATYISVQFNPGKSGFFKQELAELCDSNGQKSFAKEFLKDSFKLNYENFREQYEIAAKWFYNKRKGKYPFPTETGYCIGYQALSEIGKSYSLKEMTKMPLQTIIEKMITVIKSWK
jgi:hypothetical protein